MLADKFFLILPSVDYNIMHASQWTNNAAEQESKGFGFHFKQIAMCRQTNKAHFSQKNFHDFS